MVGTPEILIVLTIVGLLFGGKRVAGLGKSLGKGLHEFRSVANELSLEEVPTKRQDAD